MKKKMGSQIILVAFIVIICCPQFLWILLEKYVNSENNENRVLAERPRFSLDNYESYSEEYNSYYNDNIPFRNNLITLNTVIDYWVFDTYKNDRVIVGKNNWFFYADVADGDPISCYQGTNLLSEEELQVIADNCINQRDFLAEQGKEFVIFIAPNKERIYYEYMPEQYGLPADNYKVLQIVEYLRNHTDLRVVYPYEELMEAKNSLTQNIWYKTDTHWNYIGGYVGAAALLKELGIEIPSITSEQITINKGDNVVFGDLVNMLAIPHLSTFADDEYAVIGYDAHSVQALESDLNTLFLYQAENADPRRLYVIRDSFSIHMVVYCSSQFNNSCWRHFYTYSYDDLRSYDPDIVVYEIVERKVERLGLFSIQ